MRIRPRKTHYDSDGHPRCGTRSGAELSADQAAVTCETCLNLLAGVHGLGNRRADVKPCGTPSAYRRHLRRDGKPVRCLTCLQAVRRDAADRKAQRTRRAKGLAA